MTSVSLIKSLTSLGFSSLILKIKQATVKIFRGSSFHLGQTHCIHSLPVLPQAPRYTSYTQAALDSVNPPSLFMFHLWTHASWFTSPPLDCCLFEKSPLHSKGPEVSPPSAKPFACLLTELSQTPFSGVAPTHLLWSVYILVSSSSQGREARLGLIPRVRGKSEQVRASNRDGA